MSAVNVKEMLLQELSVLPLAYHSEVLDFVEYLKTKQKPQMPETMLLSESALSKDWDTPEEDNAWASL